eukprot:TRINITY_DN39714_c0_g1_i1.p1 TRINITY_DN39714_c0_g1~~TRINITY_DN39714_c0_g1_i1.p1  ORF type:complete len:248 (+),score=11.12 TRINITY_DN39714_c0_g1_i1:70-813(+)
MRLTLGHYMIFTLASLCVEPATLRRVFQQQDQSLLGQDENPSEVSRRNAWTQYQVQQFEGSIKRNQERAMVRFKQIPTWFHANITSAAEYCATLKGAHVLYHCMLVLYGSRLNVLGFTSRPDIRLMTDLTSTQYVTETGEKLANINVNYLGRGVEEDMFLKQVASFSGTAIDQASIWRTTNVTRLKEPMTFTDLSFMVRQYAVSKPIYKLGCQNCQQFSTEMFYKLTGVQTGKANAILGGIVSAFGY